MVNSLEDLLRTVRHFNLRFPVPTALSLCQSVEAVMGRGSSLRGSLLSLLLFTVLTGCYARDGKTRSLFFSLLFDGVVGVMFLLMFILYILSTLFM